MNLGNFVSKFFHSRSKNAQKAGQYNDGFAKISNHFVPYACHLGDTVCVTKNGEVFQVIKIELNDFKLNQEGGFRDHLRMAILDNILDFRTAFWIQTVKRKVDQNQHVDLDNIEDNSFQEFLHNDYTKYNEKLNTYQTVIFITIFRQGVAFKIKPHNILKHVTGLLLKEHDKHLDKEIQNIKRVSSKIIQAISDFSPKLLSLYVGDDNATHSEVIEFLYYIVNFRDQKCPLKESDISNIVNDSRYKFTNSSIILKKEKNLKYLNVFSLKETPIIPISVISDLLGIPAELIITEYVSYIDRQESIKFFKNQIKLLENQEDKKFQQEMGLSFLTTKNSDTKYCQSSISMIFVSNSYEELLFVNKASARMFSKYGIVAVKEDISLHRTYLSIMPGNFSFIHRMSVHDASEMGMFAYSFVPIEHDDTSFLNNKRLFTVGTLKNNPISFGVLKDDYNILITGLENSGKTVLSNFIAAQLLISNPAIPVYIIDINNKSRTFVDALSGSWYQVSLNRQKNSANFNALDFSYIKDLNVVQEYLMDFLSLLMAYANVLISPKMQSDMLKVIDGIIALSKQNNKLVLHDIRYILKDYPEIAQEIQSWHSIGKYYHLFDNRNDIFNNDSNVKCIFVDDTIVSDANICANVIHHMITNIIYRNTSKQLSLLIIDEPFVVFGNPFFKSKLQNIIDLAKEYNIILLLKIGDLSKESTTIVDFHQLIQSCKTRIFFGNKNADDNYNRIFQLEKFQYLAIKTLGQEFYNFLMLQNENVYSCNFNLEKIPKTVSILSDTGDIKNRILSIKESVQSDIASRWLGIFYSDLDLISSDNDELTKADLSAMDSMKKIIEM